MRIERNGRTEETTLPVPEFPKTIVLVDTGERRHPRTGDVYMWRDRMTHEVDGPHHCDDGDDESTWYGGPECFAIYRKES